MMKEKMQSRYIITCLCFEVSFLIFTTNEPCQKTVATQENFLGLATYANARWQ